MFPALKAAIRKLGLVLGVPEADVWPQAVEQAFLGIFNILGYSRKEVKKTDPLSGLLIEELVLTYVWPYRHDIYKVEAPVFRAVITLFLSYGMMARFADLIKIQAKHVRFMKTGEGERYLEFQFPNAKNNKNKDAMTGCIMDSENMSYSPVKLVALYFKYFNLKPTITGSEGDDIPLLHRFQDHWRLKTPQYRPCKYTISRGKSLEEIRELLKDYGFVGKVTHISPKAGAVTEALEGGLSLENCALLGRWWSTTTVSHYRRRYSLAKVGIGKAVMPGAQRKRNNQ